MAKIKLNNNSYPIPDSALAGPTADFVAHLGTIAGSGLKVVVGGVEYSIDTSKVAGAIGELESVLGGLENGGDEGLANIYWDGNTEGLDTVIGSDMGAGAASGFARVSDKYVSPEEALGAAVVFKNGNNPDIEFVIDDASVSTQVNGITFADTQTYCVNIYGSLNMILWVHSDETALLNNGESVEFKAGTWLFYITQDGTVAQYVQSVEFPSN